MGNKDDKYYMSQALEEIKMRRVALWNTTIN